MEGKSLLHPIDLDDSPPQQAQINTKLQQARNRSLIQQAILTRLRTQICLAAVKTKIPGDKSQKIRCVNKQIIDYFYNAIGIKIHSEHFHKRLEPDYTNDETQPNPCELILYGVDFLTTEMLLDRFKIVDASILAIKWINDSTCKLKYSTAEEVRSVLVSQMKDPSILKLKMEDVDHLDRGWFALKSYEVYSFERPLQIRYATVLQNQIEKNSINKFKDFEEAEARVYPYLLEKFKAFEKYKEILEQIERERHINFIRNRKSVEPRNRTRDMRQQRNQGNQSNQERGRGNHRQQRYDNDERRNRGNYRSNNEVTGDSNLVEIEVVTKSRYEHRVIGRDQNYRDGNRQRNNRFADNRGFNKKQAKVIYYDSEKSLNNLSFDIKGSGDKRNQTFQNLDFNFKEANNLSVDYRNGENLDFKTTNLASREDFINNNSFDTSFRVADKADPFKNKEKEDLSFKLKIGNIDHQNIDDLDFDLGQEISPIHQNNSSNYSFVMQQKIKLHKTKMEPKKTQFVSSKFNKKQGKKQQPRDCDSQRSY